MRISTSTTSPEQTCRLASSFAPLLVAGDVVALIGDLGAGKTTFVRGLAEAMGIDPQSVSSPTFVIMHEYESPDGRLLVHMDAYRVGDDSEIDALGWDDLVAARDAVIVVEWPERIANRLPSDLISIRILHAGNENRDVEIHVPESLNERFAAIAEHWPGFILQRQSPQRSTGIASDTDQCPVCTSRLTDRSHDPFCSERCRLVDLGQWFRGKYQISRPLQDDELNG